MAERAVEVAAADAASALGAAAKVLGAAPEDVALTELGGGRYRAVLIRADAALQIGLSDDKMRATVKAFAPAVGAGRALTAADVRQALVRAGATAPPDPAAVVAAVERAARGEDLAGAPLAHGTAPTPASDARLELLGDPSAPVFPGDLFARKVPAQPARPGRSLDGREVKPPAGAAKDQRLALRTGVRLESDNVSLRAETWGRVHVEKGQVSIAPSLALSPDRLQATGGLTAKDFFGAPVTLEHVRRALAAAGVRLPPDEAAVEAGLARARETGAEVRAVLAQGTAAVPGQDGRLELAVATARSAGLVHADGSVDYHERNLVHSVAQGALLGKVLPPTKGVAGCDVLGRTLPARDGQPASISVGRGVQRSRDGVDLTAITDGVITSTQGLLEVTREVAIAGDVDYASGNVRVEHGAVVVRGSVRTGFTVKVGGSLVVGDTVGGALIEASGDVEVMRGIAMHGKGRVIAGGSIRCHFAENARLKAGKDVLVDNDLTACEVEAGGRVIATRGRGRIQGGVVRAGGGVEAHEIGSELETATEIWVVQESPALLALEIDQARLEAVLDRVAHAIGPGDPPSLEQLAPARRRQVAEQLQARAAAQRSLDEVREKLQQERVRLDALSHGTVIVRRMIHPGTLVIIGGCRFRVDAPIKGGELYRIPKEHRIALGAA